MKTNPNCSLQEYDVVVCGAAFHDSPPGLTMFHDMAFKRANRPPPNDFYEIPYRCLLPQKINGLLVAGRCISCDRDALASMRVQPTCMFTGHAAGLAAALAVKEGIEPHLVDAALVARETMKPCAFIKPKS